jgi:hypothetical protein
MTIKHENCFAQIEEFVRYVTYVSVTLKAESYWSWKRRGAPKPLPKPNRHFDVTTKSEILRVFSHSLRIQTRCIATTTRGSLSRLGV